MENRIQLKRSLLEHVSWIWKGLLVGLEQHTRRYDDDGVDKYARVRFPL
jgi:hypothetical protein